MVSRAFALCRVRPSPVGRLGSEPTPSCPPLGEASFSARSLPLGGLCLLPGTPASRKSLELLWILLLAGLALLPVVRSVRRSTELFVLQFEAGRLRHVRGRLPPSLLNDLAGVVEGTRLEDFELKVVRRDGEPVLMLRRPLGAGTEQQLRNVLGQYPVARIQAGLPAPKR